MREVIRNFETQGLTFYIKPGFLSLLSNECICIHCTHINEIPAYETPCINFYFSINQSMLLIHVYEGGKMTI